MHRRASPLSLRRVFESVLWATVLAVPTLALPAQARQSDLAGAIQPAAVVPDERTLLAMTNPDYMVTPGDVYALTYWVGTSLVSMNLVIDSNYAVNLEAFGLESARGLTFVGFKGLVKDSVARAYPASWPQVSIGSTGVFEVYLKGEVTNSGYRSAWGLTRLSEVLKDQLTPYSSIRDVQVTAIRGAVQKFDLFYSMRNGRSDQDPFVRPGDTIVVRAYLRQVTISGEVRRPGTYQLLEDEGLRALVEVYGGGLTRASLPTRVELESTDRATDRRRMAYLDLSRAIPDTVPLGDGDVLVVPSRVELMPVVYFQGAFVPANADPQEKNAVYRERYRLREGETLLTALRTVTITPQADLTGCYAVRYDPERDIVLRPLDTIVIPYVR